MHGCWRMQIKSLLAYHLVEVQTLGAELLAQFIRSQVRRACCKERWTVGGGAHKCCSGMKGRRVHHGLGHSSVSCLTWFQMWRYVIL
jgi:hypothetical protein